MHKKSQISVFATIGILLIVFIGIFFAFKHSSTDRIINNAEDESTLRLDESNTKELIRNCLNSELKNAVEEEGFELEKIENHVSNNLQLCLTQTDTLKLIEFGDIILETRKSADWEIITLEASIPLKLSADSDEPFLVSYKTWNNRTIAINESGFTKSRSESHSPNELIKVAYPSTTKLESSDGAEISNIEVRLIPSQNPDITVFNYDLKPDGSRFNPYINLEVKYKDKDNDGFVDGTSIPETNLVIDYFDDSMGRWMPLDTERDKTNNILKAKIKHFCQHGINNYNTYTANVFEIDPLITPNITQVQLKGLLGNGYLEGEYVSVYIGCEECNGSPGPRIYREDNIFVFEPIDYGETNYFKETYDGQHFDEVMSYYGASLPLYYFRDNLSLDIPKVEVILFDPNLPAGYVEARIGNKGAPSQFAFPLEYGTSIEDMKCMPLRSVRGMFHEVTHLVFEKNIGSEAKNKIKSQETSMMVLNEAIADYFAVDYFGDPVFTTCSPDQEVDYDFDFQYNPLTCQYDVCKESEKFENSMNAITSTLWDIREDLGRETANFLFTQAFLLIPLDNNRDSGMDFMYAVIEADRQKDNSANKNRILTQLSKHGIDCSESTGNIGPTDPYSGY